MKENLLNYNKIVLIILFNVLVSSFAFGQNWLPLHEGLNVPINDFFVIEETNKLLLTGGFENVVNGIDCNGFCIWDGVNYSFPLEQSYWNSAFFPIQDNDLTLFIGTTAATIPDTVYSYSDNNALPLFAIPSYSQGIISYNNTYISAMGSFEGSPTIYIWYDNVLDSANFVNYEFDSLYGTWSLPQDMIVFNDELVICGNIQSTDHPEYKEIMTWNGNEFGSLNEGIPGFSALAMKMEVFNGELYIGGLFWQTEGNPTNCIMKWDGENFLPVGTVGANSRVDCLVSHNGYLYAAGAFTTMDNIPCRIAIWDGESWAAFNNDNFQFNSFDNQGLISRMEAFQDTLYVAKGFSSINDTNFNHIAKYNGTLSINPNLDIEYENSSINHLELAKVFYNSVLGLIQIENRKNNDLQIEIYNPLGQLIKNFTIQAWEQTYTYNTSPISKGVYFVKIYLGEAIQTKKVIIK